MYITDWCALHCILSAVFSSQSNVHQRVVYAALHTECCVQQPIKCTSQTGVRCTAYRLLCSAANQMYITDWCALHCILIAVFSSQSNVHHRLVCTALHTECCVQQPIDSQHIHCQSHQHIVSECIYVAHINWVFVPVHGLEGISVMEV
jgi:hypothetical protein